MVSEICNGQQNAQLIGGQIIPLASHKLGQNSNLLVQSLNVLLVTVVLAEIRGLKLVIG